MAELPVEPLEHRAAMQLRHGDIITPEGDYVMENHDHLGLKRQIRISNGDTELIDKTKGSLPFYGRIQDWAHS